MKVLSVSSKNANVINSDNLDNDREKNSEEKNSELDIRQFPIGASVVYPKHGVGYVVGTQKSIISGINVEMLTVRFEKDKLTIQVPVQKMTSSGLRKIVSMSEMADALKTLMSKSKVRKKLWSRRAQEYEAKINSGEIHAIAEVVRDLFRKVKNANQSYSERQLYQVALGRLASEVAAVEKIDEGSAVDKLERIMFEQYQDDNELNQEVKKSESQIAVA